MRVSAPAPTTSCSVGARAVTDHIATHSLTHSLTHSVTDTVPVREGVVIREEEWADAANSDCVLITVGVLYCVRGE